jgi:hypothetical protein
MSCRHAAESFLRLYTRGAVALGAMAPLLFVNGRIVHSIRANQKGGTAVVHHCANPSMKSKTDYCMKHRGD